ncbi:LysM peptidoglycan-binding domain-containing protein [Segetibacter sp. 3557_3]|uniref:glucosaminidase domain-containing protein n=1 Tax=Segetibacter sp. 3557_3 TaxID=2547429 RepID=UPI00105905C0|nr:glucosaminidase domain-containing protein [Segetibacter sp. 3557_3]TDH27868.1 LysM peptidoglycan-binding domain-containing protein [Segetibacter sp. 3557_3]
MTINTSKIILTVLASVCCFFKTVAQKEKDRAARYIEQYKELAMSEMLRTGIPASITLAQGVLETAAGQSILAQNANNHFGIKCKGDWIGETMAYDDDAKGECFRKYASVEDSYKDHSEFLRTRPNYASLFSIHPSDYQGWAVGLKKAGYATNPSYAERLMRVIEEHNLQQYTLLALQKTAAGATLALAAVSKPSPEVVSALESSSSINNDGKVSPTPAKKINYPGGVFIMNGTKVIYAEAGTSLFAIANNHRVTYNKLMEFNELDNKDILENDQLVFLEKKPKKGVNEFHTVALNESLYEICQKEAVQMSSVMEYNHLQKGMVPAVGEKLYLKIKATASPRLAMENRSSATSM